MPTSKRRVLGIDDDPFMLAFLGKYFAREGYDFIPFQSAVEAITLLDNQAKNNVVDGRIHCVICDINMPQMHGLTVLERIKAINADLPVIMITAFGSVETAVKAMKQGAYDYVTKPFHLNELKNTIEKALEFQKLIASSIGIPFRDGVQPEPAEKAFGIIGQSASMQHLFNMIRRVAPISASVLITGESGTGKELVARAIHKSGTRKGGPFVAINCAAIPENLLESELFGHVKGSFTGAVNNKRGLFAEANGGTVFLDEIGDMSLYLQAKLLRVLQEKKIRPVGSNVDEDVDVRVVSATHRDLKSMIHEGTFREDLYYRLSVIPISIPPLRERVEDIALLANFFMRKLAETGGIKAQGFTEAALDYMKQHSWKGNVRQLENFVERAAVLTESDWIDEDQARTILDDKSQAEEDAEAALVAADARQEAQNPVDHHELARSSAEQHGEPGQMPSLRDLEKQHLMYVLEKVNWKKEKAAEILGISRKTLYRKEIEYGLRPRPGNGAHMNETESAL